MSSPRMIEAWGERKSLSHWAQDQRAAVSIYSIRERLNRGQKPELAIGGPARNVGNQRKKAAYVKLNVNASVLETLNRHGVSPGAVLRQAAEAAEKRSVERIAIMEEAAKFCMCGYRLDLCSEHGGE